jgi:hypothetical protein
VTPADRTESTETEGWESLRQNGVSDAAEQELANLIYDLCVCLRDYVVINYDQLVSVALWIIHTHTIDAAETTPYLNLRSPEKQCGKTRLLEVLELLVARSCRWERPSEAVTFRAIESLQPTLLLDEIDTIWDERGNENEGLRALLNAGNRRGTFVPRCVGPTQTLKMFPTFCAKALAGINTPPDTVSDRSIPIILRRRSREESVSRFRRRDKSVREGIPALRKRVEAWAAKHTDDLRDALPELPEELSDRAQDSVEPLLAIADVAGEDWGHRAREALVNCIGGALEDSEISLRLRLLADTRTVFGELDRIWSAELVKKLGEIEDGPWRDGDGMVSLTQSKMAWMLRPYGIRPKAMRIEGEDGTRKGYRIEPFKDAWSRYLPAGQAKDEGEQ